MIVPHLAISWATLGRSFEQCELNAVYTKPEQSIPDFERPPEEWGVPRNDFAVEIIASHFEAETLNGFSSPPLLKVKNLELLLYLELIFESWLETEEIDDDLLKEELALESSESTKFVSTSLNSSAKSLICFLRSLICAFNRVFSVDSLTISLFKSSIFSS